MAVKVLALRPSERIAAPGRTPPTRAIARIIAQVVRCVRRRPGRWVPLWVVFTDDRITTGRRQCALRNAAESWDWPENVEVRWSCENPVSFRWLEKNGSG